MTRLSTTGVDVSERLQPFHPGEFKNLSQQGPGVADPALSRSLNQKTSRDPFQPSYCYDSLLSCAQLCLEWSLPAQQQMCHSQIQQDSHLSATRKPIPVLYKERLPWAAMEDTWIPKRLLIPVPNTMWHWSCWVYQLLQFVVSLERSFERKCFLLLSQQRRSDDQLVFCDVQKVLMVC